MTEYRFTSIRWIDKKKRKVIVDICGDIINRSATKEELEGIRPELSKKEIVNDKDLLLEFLRYFDKKEGRPPTTRDFNNNPRYPSHTTYKACFGSWNDAIRKAGLVPSRYLTDDESLEFLRKFERENGRHPTTRDFGNNPHYPSYTIYTKLFGCWNNALKMAGFQIKDSDKYTDKELLEHIKRFNNNEGRPPTARDFSNNPKYPNFGTYINHFGNWNNALKEAEIQVKIFEEITNEELLEYIKRFDKDKGRPPTIKDFNNDPNCPGPNIYKSRFGGWQNALKLLRLDTDSMVKKGIIETNRQKGRLAEILVFKHFTEIATDLSGEYCNNPFDGICPNGQTYDVKSSKFYDDKYFKFHISNLCRDDIELFYLLAFNEDYSKLKYAWRITPFDFSDEENLIIGTNSGYTYNIENMKNFEITEKIIPIFNNWFDDHLTQ